MPITFLRQDLVIAQDPLFFVRRHELFLERTPHLVYWPQTAQRTYNQEAGAFIAGVVFQLGMMAGKMGLTEVHADKSFSGHNAVEALTLTQIAGLRSLPWARLKQSDVHALGVRLRFARELVAAVPSPKPSMARELAEAHHWTDRPSSPYTVAQIPGRARCRDGLDFVELGGQVLPCGNVIRRDVGKQRTGGETPPCPTAAVQSIEKQTPHVDGTGYLGGALHPKTYGSVPTTISCV